MGVREDRRIARTAELLDAGMELVVAEGLPGLTIGALAERVNAAVGALYRYFPSKTALIAALQVRAVEELQGVVDAALAQLAAADADPDLRLLAEALAVPHAYYRDLVEHPARRLLINRSLAAPDPLLPDEEAQRVDVALRPLLERAAQGIAAAADAGLLDPGPAPARAMNAWAAVQGLSLFLLRDRLQPPELRCERLIGPQLVGLLRGWGADAEAAERAVGLLERAGSRA